MLNRIKNIVENEINNKCDYIYDMNSLTYFMVLNLQIKIVDKEKSFFLQFDFFFLNQM